MALHTFLLVVCLTAAGLVYASSDKPTGFVMPQDAMACSSSLRTRPGIVTGKLSNYTMS